MKKSLASTLLIIALVASVIWIFDRWYKNRADKAACLFNIRNIQTAVRSYQGVHGIQGPTYDIESMQKEMFVDMYGFPDGKAIPTCPSAGTYTWSNAIPSLVD